MATIPLVLSIKFIVERGSFFASGSLSKYRGLTFVKSINTPSNYNILDVKTLNLSSPFDNVLLVFLELKKERLRLLMVNLSKVLNSYKDGKE